jgi:hypothetical protein
MNKVGQLSIVNIMFFVIIVAVAVVCTPVMMGFIDDAVTTYNISGLTYLIMESIIPVFWLGIIATFFIYISPISQVRQF